MVQHGVTVHSLVTAVSPTKAYEPVSAVWDMDSGWPNKLGGGPDPPREGAIFISFYTHTVYQPW